MENKNLPAKISAWIRARFQHVQKNKKHRVAIFGGAFVVVALIIAGLLNGTLAFPASSWIATSSNNCSLQSNGNTLVEANGYIYVLTGSTPRFKRYDPASEDCDASTLADPGFATDGATMTAVDLDQDGTKDLLYVFPGGSGASVIYIYDIPNDKWILNTRAKATDSTTTLSAMAQPASPFQGSGNSIINVNGTLFIIETNGTFRKYDPSTNTLTDLAGNSFGNGASMVSIGNTLYALRTNNTFSSFDTTQTPGAWTTLASTPSVFNYGASLAVVGSEIYAFRGGNYKDFWRYDVANNRWNNAADGTIPASAPDGVGTGGSLVYPGSGDYIYGFQGANSRNFWRYSISGNTWDYSTLAKTPFKVGNGGSLTTDGTYLYASRGNGTKDFWKYTIDASPANPGTWTTLPEAPLDIGVNFTSGSASTDARGGITYIPTGASGGPEIFMVSGNATTSNNYGDFFRYALTGTNANSWPLVPLPTSLPNNGNYGASLSYPGPSAADPSGDFLYFLEGSNQAQFWKFSLLKNTWIAWNRATTTLNGKTVSISQNSPTAGGLFQQGSGTNMLEVNGKFYVMQANRHFQRYDPATNTWVELMDTPNYTSNGASMVKIDNNTIYAFMGNYSFSPAPSQEFWKYDIPSDTWIAFNIGKRESDGAIFDNSGTSQGNGNTIAQVNGEMYILPGGSSSTFEKYNPVSNTWIALASAPANASSGSSLSAVGTDIYYLPGQSAGNFYKYNALTNSWTTMTSLPAGTPTLAYVGSGASLAYPGSGDKIYAFKGWYSFNTYPNRQFWSYSISGNSWAQLADAPQPVGGGAALVGVSSDPANIYAMGGENSKNFWRYNITNNRWNDPGDGNIPPSTPDFVQTGGALATDGTNIFVTQGGFKKGFWDYSPSTNRWTNLQDSPVKVGQACTISVPGLCPVSLGGLTYSNDATNGGIWMVPGNGVTGVNTTQSGTDTDYRGLIYRYNTNTSSWVYYQRPSSAPAAVNSGGSLTYPGSGNLIYALKGGTSNAKDLWIYDMSANQWRSMYQAKKDDGTPLSQDNFITNTSNVTTAANQGNGNAIAEANGAFYVLQGNSNKTFQRYDPTTNTWTQLADAPNFINAGARLMEKDSNTLYAFSGGAQGSNNFWKYDIPSNTWFSFNLGQDDNGTPFSQSGTNQSTGNTIVQLGGDMYVLAGSSQTFEKYSPGTNTWTTLEPSPVSATDTPSMVAIGTNIYMEPGSCSPSSSTPCFFQYNPQTNSWTPSSTIANGALRGAPLSWGSGATLEYPGSGDYIFALRGSTTNTFWKYCFQSSGSTPSATVCSPSQVGYWSGETGPSPVVTTPAAAPSTVTAGGSMASIGSNIYAFGGNNTTNFWRYNITNDRWNDAADGDVPDSAPEGVESGGALTSDGSYIYGTKGANSVMFWRYDPTATAGSRWIHQPNAPAKMGGTTTSSGKGGLTYYTYIDGSSNTRKEIWMVSGNGRNGFTPPISADPEAGGLIFRYSISGGASPSSWTYTPGTAYIGIGPSSGSSLTYYTPNGHIYAFTSNGSTTFWEYNPTTNEWNGSNKAKLESGDPISQSIFSQGGGNNMVLTGNKLYVLQGNNTQNFQQYDPSTNQWTLLENPPAVVTDGSTMVSTDSDTIYAFRGGSTTAFWQYKISTGHWTVMATTPATVGAGGSLVYPGSGNYIYAFEGNNTTAFWRYDITTDTWNSGGAGVTPAAVYGGGSLVYPGSGNYIYAFQGNNATSFWRYDVTTAWPPSSGNWTTTLSGAPATVLSGGSLTSDGGNTLYAVRGDNTTDTWTYDISGNTWTILGAPKTTPVNVGTASTSLAKGDLVYVPSGTYAGQSTGGELFLVSGNGTAGNISTSTVGTLFRYALSGPSAGTWPIKLAPAATQFGTGGGASLSSPTSSTLIYGLTGGATTNFVSYNPDVNEWNAAVRAKLDNDVPVSNAGGNQGVGNCVVPVNKKLYILAGASTTFQQYDPATNQWTNLESLPAAAGDGASMVSTDADTIYALRGGNSTNSYVYKISTGHWTALGNTPATILTGGALGYSGSGNFIYAFRGGSNNTIYQYDITQTAPGSWTTASFTAPANVSAGGAMVSAGGAIYATTGNSSNFYRYTAAGGWVAMSSAPWPLQSGGSLSSNGTQIWASRGAGTSDIRKYCTTTDADCTAGNWAAANIAAFPTNIGTNSTINARGGLAYVDPCALTSCAVLYGVSGNGTTGNGINSIGLLFRYPFTGTNANTWPVTVNLTQPPGTIGAGGSMVTDNSSTLYVSRGGNTSDMYKYTITPNGAGSWTALTSFPTGFGGNSIIGGQLAYTTSGPSGGPEIFAVSGAGTSGTLVGANTNQVVSSGVYQGNPGRGLIFRYPLTGANANTWPITSAPPPQVQVGATTYDIGGGGSLSSIGTNIYTLQGNSTLNFLNYNITNSPYSGDGTWSLLTSVPTGSATVNVGGSIVNDGTNLYVSKGNSTGEIYRYSTGGGVWSTLSSAPVNIGTSSNGGDIAYTANGPSGGPELFATTGKGTTFNTESYGQGYTGLLYRYVIGSDSWPFDYEAADLPASTNTFGGGSDIVSTPDGSTIYALRGNSSPTVANPNFWKFIPSSTGKGTWTAMTNLPNNTTPLDIQSGGSIVATDNNTLYALRGKATTDFYRYDVGAGTWTAQSAFPVNVGSASTSNDTGELAYDSTYGSLYATPGNDTTAPYTIYKYGLSRLVVTAVTKTGGGTPVAGQSMDVTVQRLDQNDNPLTSGDMQFTVSLKTGNGSLGGTITGNITNGNSSTTITGTTYSIADGGVVLTASDTTSPANPTTLAPGDSDPFSVDPPAPQITSLNVTSGPTDGRTGVTISGSDFTNYYIRPITINNPGSALSGYQVQVIMDTASLINAGKMRPDCGDIRFTDSIPSTSLGSYGSGSIPHMAYWLEPNTCDTISTKFWVYVGFSLNSGDNTIYANYGDFRLSDESSGTNTFIFYDDFTGTTIDTGKWTKVDASSSCTQTSYFSQNEKLLTSGGPFNFGCNGIYSNLNFDRSSAIELEMDYKTINNGNFVIGWKDTTTGTSGTSVVNRSNFVHSFYSNSTGSDDVYENNVNKGTSLNSQNWVANQQYKLKIILYPSGGAIYQRSTDNGNSWVTWMDTTSGGLTTTPVKIGFGDYSGQVEIDNVKVREYTANEPTATIGTESPTLTVSIGDLTPSAAVNSVTSGNINVTTNGPNNTGAFDTVVTDSDGQTITLPNSFTFNDPTFTSIDPDNGVPAGGTAVTITGTNFTPSDYTLPVTISNNSASTLADYQASFTVDTASLIETGKMTRDGRDIRFFDSDGTTPITNFWIEGPMDSAATKIWVKVPIIAASGNTTIYMHYSGDTSLTSQSNTTNTFIREIDTGSNKGAWPMDEVSGTTVTDSSGNGNTGTMEGTNAGTNVVSGKFNNARSFNGSNNDIDAGNASPLGIGGALTVEVWENMTTTGYYPRMVSNVSACCTYNGYELLFNGSNPPTPFLELANNGTETTVTAASTVAINSGWHHIVGTYDGTYARIYIDGNLSNTAQLNQAIGVSTTNLQIGHWINGGSSYYFPGQLDDVRIYNRALSAAEITDLYNNNGYTTTNSPGKVLVRKFQHQAANPNLESVSAIVGTATGSIPVQFDTSSATVSDANNTTVLAVTPAHTAATVPVAVTNLDGANATGSFIYGVPPNPTSVSPNQASINGGDTVDVYGTDFVATPQVLFDGTASSSVTFIDSTHLQALVPAHTGTGPVDVQVINPNTQQGTLTGGFSYTTITDPNNSTVVASPTNNLEDDGVDTSTVTVTLLDSSTPTPQPAPDKTVQLAASNVPSGGSVLIDAVNCSTGASLNNVPPDEATTGADGKACFKVSTSPASARGTSGTYTFQATDITTSPITVVQTADVTFVDLIANKTNSTFTAPGGSVAADGVSTKLLTATILNKNNVIVDGNTVSVSQVSGPGTATISAVTNPTNTSGVATFNVSTTTIGTYTFEATASSGTVTMDDPADIVTVDFTAGPTDPSTPHSTLTADTATVAADNANTATLTGLFRDQFDNPVIDTTVSFSQTSGPASSTITPVDCPNPEPAGSTTNKTNTNGKACATVVANLAGVYVFQATDTDNSVTLNQTVSITYTGPTQANSTIAASSSTVAANGLNSSTITMTLKDASNNLFGGRTVTMTKTPGLPTDGINAVDCSTGATLGGNSTTSDGNGQACFKVTNTSRGSFTYQAVNTTEGTPTLSTNISFVEGPAWDTNGNTIANAVNDDSTYAAPTRTKVLRTTDGSYITIWMDNRSGSTYSLFAQKYNSSGAPQWTPSSGLQLFDGSTVSAGQWGEPEIISDNSTGAFVTWIALNSGTSQYELQGRHVSSTGSFLWGASPKVVLNATHGGTYLSGPGEDAGYSIIADGTGGAFIAYRDYNLSNYYKSVTRIDSSGNVVTGDATSWPTRLGIGSTCSGGAFIDLSLVSPGVVRAAYPDESDVVGFCIGVNSDVNINISTLNSTTDYIANEGRINIRTNVSADTGLTPYTCNYSNPVHGTQESKSQWNERSFPDGSGGAYTLLADDCTTSTSLDDGMLYLHYGSDVSTNQVWNVQLTDLATLNSSGKYDAISDGNGGIFIVYLRTDGVFAQHYINNGGTPQSLFTGGTAVRLPGSIYSWKLVSGPTTGTAYVLFNDSGNGGTLGMKAVLLNSDGSFASAFGSSGLHIHNVMGYYIGDLNYAVYATNASELRTAISDGSGGLVAVGEGSTHGFANTPYINDVDNYILNVNSSGVLQWGTADDIEISPGADVQNTILETQQNQKMVTTSNNDTIVAWEDEADQSYYGSSYPPLASEFYSRLTHYGQHVPVADKIGPDGTSIWNPAYPGRGVPAVYNDTSTTTDHTNLSIAADQTSNTPNGGLLMAWKNVISNGTSTLFAQKLDSSGKRNTTWGGGNDNGRQMNTPGSNNSTPQILSDGNGGAFVAWISDSGTFPKADVVVGRIVSTDGTYDSNWGSNYKNVTNTNGLVESNPKMVRSGGYLYIAYEEDNTAGGRASDIYMAKVNETTGSTISAFYLVAITNTDEHLLDMNVDGNGNINILYSDDGGTGGKHRIIAKKMDTTGGTFWTTVVSSTADDNLNGRMASDNNNGMIVTWEQYDATGTASDIAVQRLDINGNKLWNDGDVISNSSQTVLKQNPHIVRDGSNSPYANDGAVITWDQANSGGTANYIYTQRVVNGIAQWDTNGMQITNTARFDQYPLILGDDNGGGIITWQGHASPPDIFGQSVIEGDHAYNSTFVKATSLTHVADGSDSELVTATLLDESGNPVTGRTITVNEILGNPANSTITPTVCASGGSAGVTNSSGESCATITSTEVGTLTFSATDTTDANNYNTITPTVSITFTAQPPTATNSTFVANPAPPASVAADGTSTALLTATMMDTNDNPVAGETVTVAQTAGPVSLTPSATPCNAGDIAGVTNSSGQACFLVSSTTIGTYTFQATDTTSSVVVTQTADVLFSAGDPDPNTSSFIANPTSVPNDGVTTSTLTATVRDIYNNPVTGANISVSKISANAGTPTFDHTSTTTNNAGVATFAVSNTTLGTDTYAATLDDVSTPGGYAEQSVTHIVPGSGGTWTSVFTDTANHDDDTAAVALPFTFNFFGTNYTTAYMCSNGYIQFTGGTCSYQTSSFGSGSGLPRIAGYFNDLYFGYGVDTMEYDATSIPGEVRFHFNLENCCGGGSPTHDFEIDLFSDGHIDYHYADTSGQSGEVIGIDSGTASSGCTDSTYCVRSSLSSTNVTTQSTEFAVGSGGPPQITQTADVTYLNAPGSNSTITANPTAVPNDNTTASTITVNLLDDSDNPIVGSVVTISQTAGPGSPTVTPALCASGGSTAGTTNTNGDACFTVTSDTVGVDTFSATDVTDGNTTISSTVDIEFTCAVGTPGSGNTSCGIITITPNTGSLSITKIPDSFSFPDSYPGGESFNNATGPDDGDRVTVQDTRNSGGFTLELQASTNFADINNASNTIPLTDLYVATSTPTDDTTDANGLSCNGIQYLETPAIPDCANVTSPINAQFNILGGFGTSTTYTNLTGNTVDAAVDLMQTATNHNGSYSQFVNYYLSIPQATNIGNYQVTLTFTAL